MLEEKLNEVFAGSTIKRLQNNTDFNFEIKSIRPQDNSFQLLMTTGMSAFEQNVKHGYETFRRIELYFCLPEYWDLEKNPWPIHWLNRIAELPQKNRTWFGPGDTIPAGNPPERLSEKLEANHFMLIEPIALADLLGHTYWEKENICFFAVVPILQPELDYKIRNSATILTRRLKAKGYDEKVDLFRTSVCRKRFLGF